MNRSLNFVLAALCLLMTPCAVLADELMGPDKLNLASGLEVAPLAQLAPRLALGETAHIEKAQLAYGQLPVDLDLVRFEVFTAETEIHIQDEQGVRIEKAPANIYLRGKVTGDPSSLVVLSLNEDGSVQGLASWQAPEGGERISILEGPGADGFLRGEIVDPDYFKSDVGKFRCGADELPAALPKKATLAELVGLQSSEQGLEAEPLFAVTHTARLAIETDYEFYQKFNNATTMTNYVGSLFAYMSGIYEGQVDTNLIVTYLKIYTTSTDPWRETNSVCALNEFGKYWNINRTGVSRTIAHFLSGKSTGGGVAWLGVLCSGPFDSSVSGCINVSGTGSYGGDYGFTGDMDGNFDPGSPSVIWDIVATSHEIGHNFDSPHTHCYNNIGGSTQPIDKCFNSEPGCYSGTTSLPGPQGAGSGIIMSYCHLLTGGMSNMSLNFGAGHSYGTLPGRVATRMKAHVDLMADFSPACLAQRWQLKLAKSGAGAASGTVTSSPAGINCGSTCDALYANATSVTLTASAPVGTVFAGWSGSSCSGTGTCVVNMTRARAVTATFNTVATFNLNVTKSGAGSGTVTSNPAGINCGATCSAAYNTGTSVTLTASPEVGSTFTGWSGAGCSGTGTCVVNMTTTRNVAATFAVSNYPLSVAKSGSGTGGVTSSPAGINCGATCSANFAHGTSVTLTAAATVGSTFTGWSGEGCSGTGTCVVSMTQARNVTATFTLDTYTLSVAKSGTGTGDVTSSPAGINCGATCSAIYDHGTSVTLTAAAAVGSTFTGWSGEGCSGTGTCVVAMTQARNVTATFALNSYILEIWMNGPGAGLVSSTPAGISCSGGICSAPFDHGTSVTLSANPNPGSIFLGWKGAGCTGTGACVVAMTEASLVSANFEVVCAPGCELFADGFESGDLSGWN